MALALRDKQKLITILLVLLALGFAVTTLLNYYVSKATIRNTIVASELPLTSDNLYSEIQKDLLRPIFVSSMMASDTFLRDWVLSGEVEVQRMTRYLREIKDRYGAFTSFFISERTKTYYQTAGILKRVSESDAHDIWYFRVRELKEPFEISVDTDQANRDALTIFINYRVLDYDGRFIGIAGMGLTVDAVRALIVDYQKRFNRTIYFVDSRGDIALFGNSGQPSGTNIRTMEGLSGIADRIFSEGAGSFQYQAAGQERLLNVRFIPELKWFLFVEGTEDEALHDIRKTLLLNLAICFVLIVVILLSANMTLNRYQARLEAMATTDKLTGLANRQAFELLMPQATGEARRSGETLFAVMIDIDHFKDVNDRYGHQAGDQALQAVARTIKETLRESDIVCRWGGEEFLVVVKGAAPDHGGPLGEKIRRAVEALDFVYRKTRVPLTISLGVAAARPNETTERLISRADKALYRAKETGRNRVSSGDDFADTSILPA